MPGAYDYAPEDEELAQLLTQTDATGHPEWGQPIRAALENGSMSEADAIAALKEHMAPKEEAADDEEEDLTNLTKAELQELADERGVEIPSGASKAEMVEALGG